MEILHALNKRHCGKYNTKANLLCFKDIDLRLELTSALNKRNSTKISGFRKIIKPFISVNAKW